MKLFQLAPSVRIRSEYFGGLVYDSDRGTILEVDKEAYNLLELMRNGISLERASIILPNINKQNKHSVSTLAKITNELLNLGLIVGWHTPGLPFNNRDDGHMDITKRWPVCRELTAPEVVHWAITYHCRENCPDCYTRRHSDNFRELSRAEAFKMIDIIAEWGVFQLAIGGGEPLTRKDLIPIIQYAKQRGLSVHLTTSGILLNKELLVELASFLTCLQIGIHPDKFLHESSNGQFARLGQISSQANSLGLKLGANLMLCRSVLKNLEDVVEKLISLGFQNITLLRYKPPFSIERWVKETPEPYEIQDLDRRVGALSRKYEGLMLRIDCAFSFLERDLQKKRAELAGIKGCTAGRRIVSLTPDGNLYPCSQLVHPTFFIGNIIYDDCKLIWKNSKPLNKCRNFRQQKSYLQSNCGICKASDQCGGCRIFSDDFLGHDPGCPGPIVNSTQNLGKNRRIAEFKRYLESYGGISVGEYMARYNVGQKRAVREIKAFPGIVCGQNQTGRRKVDKYEYFPDDIIEDIQDSIGHTSGGAPYATREQIAQWIGDPSGTVNYPGWLYQEVMKEEV